MSMEKNPSPEEGNRYERKVMLTRKEAAGMLGISMMHVSNLVDSGQLRAVNMATSGARRRALRIPISELNRFLRDHELNG